MLPNTAEVLIANQVGVAERATNIGLPCPMKHVITKRKGDICKHADSVSSSRLPNVMAEAFWW